MHVRADELELYVLDRLSKEQTSGIAEHLSCCPVCDHLLAETRQYLGELSRLSRSQSAHSAEKRKYARFPTDDLAEIKLIYPNVSEPLSIRVLDVSKEGLKVRLSHPLLTGITVEVRTLHALVFAEVRYCVEVGDFFEAGVQIQDVIPRKAVRGE